MTLRASYRFCMLASAILLAFAIHTAKAKPQLPSVDQVIDKYEQAIGGRAAWEKLKSVRIKGKIEFVETHQAGSFEYLGSAPNNVLTMITLENGTVLRQGCNGLTVWKANPQGVTIESGDEWDDGVRDADFYAEINMRKHYRNMVVVGETEVDGHKAYTVLAPVRKMVDKRFFFDEETGLKLASDTILAGPNPQRFVDKFSDYRQTGGVRFPFEQGSSEGKMVVHVTEIQWNVPVIDAAFIPPANPR